jgi:murein DD-endopeptidase MepM/ murein hydrolase activator NlpD
VTAQGNESAEAFRCRSHVTLRRTLSRPGYFVKIFRTTLAVVVSFAGTLGAQATRLSIAPVRPEPGAIVRLTLADPASRADAVVSVRGSMAGEPLHFLPSGPGTWHAIGGVPVDATGSLLANAEVRHASGKIDLVRARVTLPKLPPPVAQPLAVDSSFSRPLDSATAARVERENARAREVGKRAHDSPLMWTTSFLRPRTSAITSEFGSGRVFNGKVTSRHLGVDFRGAVGEPVRAANRGVVALADNFFLAGNVVYIDHGGGLVTAYFHLSKTLVSVGDTVARGQVIGLVGATGRVTGPHLHWAARYGSTTVNPLDLIPLNRNWYGASLVRGHGRASRTSGAR